MSSIRLADIIKFWNEWVGKPDNKHYDLALFKIWIQFEKVLSQLFELYILGDSSLAGYSPQRRLQFSDLTQYRGISMRANEKYIDYMQHAKDKSKLIFEQHDNPFESIFVDPNFANVIKEVQAIRNFVAHESPEARKKYKNSCLGGVNKADISPNDFLQRMRKKQDMTNFTYYTEKLVEIIRYCEDPRPYVQNICNS